MSEDLTVKRVSTVDIDDTQDIAHEREDESGAETIKLVSDDAIKDSTAGMGLTVEKQSDEEASLADDKKARKQEIKKRKEEYKEEFSIKSRKAKKLAKTDVKTDAAAERVNRSTYFIDEQEYNKYKEEHPKAEHLVLLDNKKYKEVFESKMFDDVFEGRERDENGNITKEGTLNSDKLKEFMSDAVGDYKLDLEENVIMAGAAGLTNKKGRVRRKDARVMRRLFEDMGFAIEKDCTDVKRLEHVLFTGATTALITAIPGTAIGELTSLLGVNGEVTGTVVGTVAGSAAYTAIGYVSGTVSYSGETDFSADYEGTVSGTATGPVTLPYSTDVTTNFFQNGASAGSETSNVSGTTTGTGELPYEANYSGTVTGTVGFEGEATFTKSYKHEGEVAYNADYKADYKAAYKSDPSLLDKMKDNAISGFVGGATMGLLTMGKINDIKNPPTENVLENITIDEFVDNKAINRVTGKRKNRKTNRAIATQLFSLGATDDEIKEALKTSMGGNSTRMTQNELLQAYIYLKNQKSQSSAADESADEVPEEPVNVEETVDDTEEEIQEPPCKATAEKNTKTVEADVETYDIRGKELYHAIQLAYNIKSGTETKAAVGIIKEKHNISQQERKKNIGISYLKLERELNINGKTYIRDDNFDVSKVRDIVVDNNKSYKNSKGYNPTKITVEYGKVTLSCDSSEYEYDTLQDAQDAAEYYNQYGKLPEK